MVLGTITITVVADKAVVDKAPGLVGDLRLDDVRAAGWAVEGPTATPDGGLQVVLSQPFSTPAQANAILANVNSPAGPLVGITFGRVRGDDATTFTINGTSADHRRARCLHRCRPAGRRRCHAVREPTGGSEHRAH
jgi:hypothetical protein